MLAQAPDQEFCFSALRGVQAGRHFYSFLCPLGAVSTLFRFTDEHAEPEQRAQRSLNRTRVPEIAKYIVENPETYVFSAIAASVDLDAIRFEGMEGTSGDIGKLFVRMDSPFLVNDGQHRRAAISDALKIAPELRGEAISVVLFVDAGLRRSQQMFADLNRHAVRSNKSLNVLYDHRDEFSSMVVRVAREIPMFRQFMDMERTQISNRTRKLFTLNSFAQGTRSLLGLGAKSQMREPKVDEHVTCEFWRTAVEKMDEWHEVLRGHSTCKELRDRSISVSGLALAVLGRVGYRLREEYAESWLDALEGLREIDWSRENPEWSGVAIHGGKLSKRLADVQATADLVAGKVISSHDPASSVLLEAS